MVLSRRAGAFCDAKKLHMAAIGIFERCGFTDAARSAAAALCRKLPGSAKACLRRIDVLPPRCKASSLSFQHTSADSIWYGVGIINCISHETALLQGRPLHCMQKIDFSGVGFLQVWLRHIELLLRGNQPDAARKLLDRALQALPRRKHIKVRPSPSPPLLQEATCVMQAQSATLLRLLCS